MDTMTKLDTFAAYALDGFLSNSGALNLANEFTEADAARIAERCFMLAAKMVERSVIANG